MRWICIVALCWFSIGPARSTSMQVDVELVLAVDVSRSMSLEELEIQRDGYAEALRDPRVARAVRSGPLGRVAMMYMEWAGTQNVVADWTVIESADDLDRFAKRLTVNSDNRLRRTSISGVLAAASRSIAQNRFEAPRRVIDVSGDGPNNLGEPVAIARDQVLKQGITVNGLPLMTEDARSRFGIPELDVYYRNSVAGGIGHFVVPVTTWEEFPHAVRRKLVQELVALPRAVPVQFNVLPQPYDCLVGERQWDQFRRYLR